MNVIPAMPKTAEDRYSIFAKPPGLQDRYSVVEIISHRRHLGRLENERDNLIVSTDWLAWRELRDRGRACLHFDSLLAEWPEPLGDPSHIHRRSCEWVYDAKGQDMTLFRGISLGKLFVRNVSLFTLHYGRAWHGLDRLFGRYRCQRIVLHDLRLRLDLLDDDAKRDMLRALADRHSAVLVDRLDAPSPGDPGFPERAEGLATPLCEPMWKASLRGAYAWLVDAIFRLRPGASRRRPVFLMLNWLAARNLVAQCHRAEVTAALFASQLPKGLAFLADCWRRQVCLMALPAGALNGHDRAQLRVVAKRLADAWGQATDDPVERAKRRFIESRIVAAGWLETRAVEIKRYLALFKRRRFARVVVGDSTNATCRVIAEAARQYGIPVDEMLNGQFLTPQRYDARTGDAHGQPCVDRLLSRGAADERWLEVTEAPLRVARIGYPALEALKGPRPVLASTDKALILPIYADGDDALAVQGCVFSHLAETVLALRQFGCRRIRIKLHVGPPNTPYFEAFLQHLGVEAEIVKHGMLVDHLDWADFVVGPVNSGALLETLAGGKPYFPFVPEPTLIDSRLIAGIPVLRSASELVEALRTGRLIDRDSILERHASVLSIPASAAAFWDAMVEA